MTSTQTTATTSTSPGGVPPTGRPWAFDVPVRRLGGLGVAGTALFGAVLVALHYLEPAMTPHDHFVSEYAISDSGVLMTAAFLLLAAGVAALAFGLRAALEPGRRSRWGWSLMLVAACGYAGAALFDADPLEPVLAGQEPTWHGMLHTASGILGFLSTISAAFVLQGAFRRSSRWGAMAGVALLFGSALAVLLVLVVEAPADAVGIAERAFVVVMLLWFGVIGSWMRHRTGDPGAPATRSAVLPGDAGTRALAVVVLVGALTFAVAVVIVGALEPGLSLSQNFVSDYALADSGLVLTIGFLAIGAAHVALGLGLRRSLHPSRRRSYASWALVVVGISSVLSGLFPSRLWTDPVTHEPGWHQIVHETSGLLDLPIVIGIFVALGGAYRRDPRWRPFAGIQRMFTVVFLVLLVVFLGVNEAEIGTAQRSHQAVIVAWFSVTALHLVWVSRAGRASRTVTNQAETDDPGDRRPSERPDA